MHTFYRNKQDWYIFQPWKANEVHVMRGHGRIGEAPGYNLSVKEADKFAAQLKQEGYRKCSSL